MGGKFVEFLWDALFVKHTFAISWFKTPFAIASDLIDYNFEKSAVSCFIVL